MTDKTAHDVTNEERMLARKWAAYVESNTDYRGDSSKDPWGDRVRAAARVILNAVPSPTTLADMTLDEQAECTGMQADLVQGDRVVILDGTPDHDGLVQVLETSLDVYSTHPDDVTPRPDLPRMEWPGTEKPAPALPDGWRLADHKEDGRVIVTNPTPDPSGHVYFVMTSPDDPMGYDWFFCTPAELTYLDQEADQ